MKRLDQVREDDLVKELIRHLREREAPGAVVNILSVNVHGGTPDLAIYAGSKAALAVMTVAHVLVATVVVLVAVIAATSAAIVAASVATVAVIASSACR